MPTADQVVASPVTWSVASHVEGKRCLALSKSDLANGLSWQMHFSMRCFGSYLALLKPRRLAALMKSDLHSKLFRQFLIFHSGIALHGTAS